MTPRGSPACEAAGGELGDAESAGLGGDRRVVEAGTLLPSIAIRGRHRRRGPGAIGETGEAGDDLGGARSCGVGAGGKPEFAGDEGDGSFADGGVEDQVKNGSFERTGSGAERVDTRIPANGRAE